MLSLIEAKTGIQARHYAAEGQFTSDLAAQAAEHALAKGGMAAQDINCILLATSSPDRPQPATATRVQHLIGAKQAFAFDLNSVCSGAIYGMAVADSLIQSGFCQNVLLVAAELYSRILNPRDFATCPYFGDGAGAVLLAASRAGPQGICGTSLKTSGSGAEVIQVPGGGSMKPLAGCAPRDLTFQMQGREVYDFAVTQGAAIIAEALYKAMLPAADVKLVIPHQANINIIKEISVRSGIPLDKFHVNLQQYGNTAAASVLIALDEAVTSGALRAGDRAVLVSFGGGLSWGATVITL